MKTLQNDFTTPEQSKRLLELGVPADSADCYLTRFGIDEKWEVKVLHNMRYSETSMTNQNFCLPCWSVGRLIEIICNCHIINNQLMENWICCDKNTNLIELLIRDIEVYTNAQHIDFSKLEE